MTVCLGEVQSGAVFPLSGYEVKGGIAQAGGQAGNGLPVANSGGVDPGIASGIIGIRAVVE